MFRKLFKRKTETVSKNSGVGTQIPRVEPILPWGFNPLQDQHMRENAVNRAFQQPLPVVDGTMDSVDNCFISGVGDAIQASSLNPVVPTSLLTWYSNQSFIGYQLAAIMAQHWLISKCCLMPAKDATRNGYEITVNDGTEVDQEILDELRRQDERFHINKNLIEFVQMGRVFGIRIAMFLVDVPDQDEYYANPFNPDMVTPGSYRGITQIDPYWIIPQMSGVAASDPSDKHFYEPTWWVVNGRKVHRTHLVIFRTEELADILKPTYLYGSIPIPQKIYERVYAAERTANEAPLLAMSKRLTGYKTDTAQIANNPMGFMKNIESFAYFRDNFGIKVMGLDEEISQFETSLNDLDAVIMTQYQIVAAAANVPAVKLLGTTPKGFNATGEFEEANYHEELESIQTHDLSPLLQRHHLLVILSEIVPKYKIEPFTTSVAWNTLDAMTAREQAEVNRMNAETGQVLVNSGAIDGADERKRIINDPESGYNGLENETGEYELGDDPTMLLNESINVGA